MRRRALALALLAAAVLAATPALADFRHARMGARPRSMGSAYASLSDDPNAVFWNPAGLARGTRWAAMVTRAWPYAVPELGSDDLVITLPGIKGVHVGVGAIRMGIDDLYYEDTYALAAGARVPWVKGLSAGAAVKLLRLAAPGYERYNDPAYNGGDSGVAWDLGLHYEADGPWTLGAVVQNLNEPRLQLLDTTVDPDAVFSAWAAGGSYLFRDTLLIACDARSRDGDWTDVTLHGGAEIWFFDALALRAGISGGQVSMGIGLQDEHWQADVALESVEELGNVYQFSFTVRK